GELPVGGVDPQGEAVVELGRTHLALVEPADDEVVLARRDLAGPRAGAVLVSADEEVLRAVAVAADAEVGPVGVAEPEHQRVAGVDAAPLITEEEAEVDVVTALLRLELAAGEVRVVDRILDLQRLLPAVHRGA